MVKKNKKSGKKLFGFLKSVSFQRLIALFITFGIINHGSLRSCSKKYKLAIGSVSQYDINAPRDIENTLKTRENAELKAAGLKPVIVPIEGQTTALQAVPTPISTGFPTS